MKRLSWFVFMMAAVSNSYAYNDYSYPKLEMPWWLTFMGLLMIAWAILEIVLFFKIWGMTNDVSKLTNHFCKQANVAIGETADKALHIPTTPNGYKLDKYDKRLDEIKVGDKVRRVSDGKILEVIGVGDEALECRGGMLDGIHSYPKDTLSIV